MTHDLYRLVYFSLNLLPGPPEATQAEIHGILAASRRNNARAGVTGALMFNAGSFAQVLEGPQDAVEATFERIQQDPRHSDVTLLDFSPLAQRGFPSWSMGFVGAQAESLARFGGIAGESGFDPAALTGDHIYESLTRLVLQDEAAA